MRAFDTGPGVAVIDAVDANARSRRGATTSTARWRRAGTSIDGVVDELLDASVFREPAAQIHRTRAVRPRVRRPIHRALSRARAATAAHADIVATATALTARSIADAYRRFMPEPVTEVLLSGGGAKNPTLRRDDRARGRADARARVRRVLFDGEAKEAVAFALLAYLHLEPQPGNVPRATGARGPRILGKLTPA